MYGCLCVYLEYMMSKIDWEYYEDLEESSLKEINKPKSKIKKAWKQVNEQKQKKLHKKKWKNKRRSGYVKQRKDT